jgi:hypothetical protein
MPFWRCAAQTDDVSVAADTYGRSGWASALNMRAHAKIRCYWNVCPRMPCRAFLRRLDERLRLPLTFLHFSPIPLPNSVWQAVGFPAADHHAPRWRQERRRKEGQRLRKFRACMYALCVCWYAFCVLHFCVCTEYVCNVCTVQKHVLHACRNMRENMHASSHAGLQACVQIECSPIRWTD